MALIGWVDEISRSRIEGWVVDSDRLGETVTVSIMVNGEHRGMCLATQVRDGVVTPSGEPVTGKCGFYFGFDPPLSPFIEQRVDVVETWSAKVLPNGSTILPRPRVERGSGSAMVPVMLTSTGRTGTTLLMSEFVRHPDMVAGDHVPYEIKQIAYHAAAFRALAADADRERSTDPENMLAHEMSQIIGSNPYNMPGLFALGGNGEMTREFYRSRLPSGLATLFRDFILEFYGALAAGQGKRSPLYLCEKGDIKDTVGQGARLFFDTVKDIVIVRDPRDLLCSAIAFWKYRPGDAMRILREAIPQVARIARHAGADTKVIRYEDLIFEPMGTRRALSEFLDLDLPGPGPDAADPIPGSHRTSGDPAASIGRWRHELTAGQVEACELAFAPYMRQFGYEPSRDAPRRTQPGFNERKTAEKRLLVAEGELAVTTFIENTVAAKEDGVPWRQMMEVRFGRRSCGEQFTLDGWADPESGFVWSNSLRSRVRLPAIHGPGNYVLHVTAAPFTHGTEVPAQRMIAWLNGHRIGTAKAREICVVSMAVPEVVSVSGRPITLTLHFPDATPAAAITGGRDKRTLGFALHRIALFQLEMGQRAADSPPVVRPTVGSAKADPSTGTAVVRGDYAKTAARIAKVLRRVFGRPEFEFRALTRLRGIPGFDPASFIRLILALEAEFSIEFHEDDVDAFESLGDILNAVTAKPRRQAQAASNSNVFAGELTGC